MFSVREVVLGELSEGGYLLESSETVGLELLMTTIRKSYSGFRSVFFNRTLTRNYFHYIYRVFQSLLFKYEVR